MARFNLISSLPLIVVGSILLILILGVVILWPRYQELKVVETELEEKEGQFQFKEQYFAKLDEIKKEFENYQTELSKIDSAVSDDPSLSSLFNFIQKASSQSGIVLKGISPLAVSPSKEMPNIKESQVSLEAVGSYSSFKNFLSALEGSARMIEVKNISFSSPEKGTVFTFNLRIKVYSY